MTEWIPLSGDILSGKTQTLYKILRELLKTGRVQVCGFFQPSRETNKIRDGYDLAFIGQNAITYKKFAVKNLNAPPKTMPWFFNNALFDEALEESKSFKFDGRPVVLLLDELGQIEVHQKGHFNAISSWVERLKGRKAFIIGTTSAHRVELAKEMMENLGVKTSELNYKVPLDDNQVSEFVKTLIEHLT